jgi:S1-C subfamily serine protease
MTKKQIAWIILISFFVGGIASVSFDRYLIPYFSTLPGLSGLRKLQSNAPIVINRVEQVRIDDGVNLLELSKQVQRFSVSIYAEKVSGFEPAGLGVILTSDGVIVAPAQLVENAKKIKVALNDGTVYDGLVKAVDRKSKLAIIAVPATGLTFAAFADAANLQVTDRVFASGSSSDDYSRIFTQGAVTQTVKGAMAQPGSVYDSEIASEFFEHNLVLDEIYIGGPLVDKDGKVLAIVSGQSGQAVGSDSISRVMSSYLSGNKLASAYLGLKYKNYPPVFAKIAGLPSEGVFVAGLEDASPLRRAGVRVNDFIVSINGSPIKDANFERVANRLKAGVIQASILRDKTKSMELTVSIEEK